MSKLPFPIASRVLYALGAALLTFTAPKLALADDSTPPSGHGVTVGHLQIGLAVFDRTGTLAQETEQRGFAPFGGGTLRIGFVHYLKAVPALGFGAGVRGTFGNSASGNQEYFFNPIFTSATVALRAPLGPVGSHLQLALDLGFTNILAKSKSADGANVLHEYGIGPGVGLLLGYSLAVPSLGSNLTLSAQHSRHQVNVDVQGGGSKSWALGVSTLLGGFEW